MRPKSKIAHADRRPADSRESHRRAATQKAPGGKAVAKAAYETSRQTDRHVDLSLTKGAYSSAAGCLCSPKGVVIEKNTAWPAKQNKNRGAWNDGGSEAPLRSDCGRRRRGW